MGCWAMAASWTLHPELPSGDLGLTTLLTMMITRATVGERITRTMRWVESVGYVDVAVEVTTNHRGFFMFRLCPNNDIMQDPEQDCFDQHVLEMELEHGMGTQRFITSWDRGYWNSTVILPADMTCSQCILQWTYTAGNDWGTCANGTEAVGCGPQEQFRACADIEIVAAHDFAELN